jgi:hypothetical protein
LDSQITCKRQFSEYFLRRRSVPVVNRKTVRSVALVALLTLGVALVWFALNQRSLPSASSARPVPSSKLAQANDERTAHAVGMTGPRTDAQGGTSSIGAPAAVRPTDNFLTSVITEFFDGSTPEICGLSAEAAREFIGNNGATSGPPVHEALYGMSSELFRRDNPADRIVGHYLLAIAASTAASEAEQLSTPGCTGSACFDRPYSAGEKARKGVAESMAELAAQSTDLDLYVAALGACRGSDSGACGGISAAQWAKREPRNAAAWLMVATNADKDNLARQQALERAVSADSYNERRPNLARAMETETFKALSPLGQHFAVMEMYIRSISYSQFLGASMHCGARETMDEGRRNLCSAVADRLARDATTHGSVSAAVIIGERAGWADGNVKEKEKLSVLKAERAQLMKSIEALGLGPNMFSCEAYAKVVNAKKQDLELGERRAAKIRAAEMAKVVETQPTK